MLFHATNLADAWLIEPQPIVDERGFFERTFCAREFRSRGLEGSFVQHSNSHSVRKGTLRGMHFQRAPHEEVKVVTAMRAIADYFRAHEFCFVFTEYGILLAHEDTAKFMHLPTIPGHVPYVPRR